jgi:MGT family glycosyltransferase
MSNIVYFNLRAHSTVNSTLGIVQELVRRGEQVDYYCYEEFRNQIESVGAQFHQLPANPDLWLDETATPQSALMETSLEAIPILLEHFQRDRPQLLISNSACLWGCLLGELLKLPTVATHIHHLVPRRFIPPLPVLLAPNCIRRFSENPKIVDKHRSLWTQLKQKYQFERVKKNDLFKLMRYMLFFHGDLNIVFTSETFQIKRENFDSSYIFTGPCYSKSSLEPESCWAKIEGKSVIYISLGTIFNQNIPFFKKCLQAFGHSHHIVVMTVGNSVDINLLGEIPPNFIVKNFVPQLEVIKYASVFIYHGGMQSTLDALTHQVPLVLFPQYSEQYLTAHRLEELGAGIWVKQQNIQPQKLRELVEKVMHDAEIRCNVERLGTSLVEAGGTQRAVEKILEFKQQFSRL